MTISLKRAPSRVLSLVGATRLARRPARRVWSGPGLSAPAKPHSAGSASHGKRTGLASSAQYSLMNWWVDDEKGTTSAGPLLAVQLDLYERRICLRGRVDDNNVDVLADVTATLITLNPGDSTVDISGVSFIDAAGIACIASLGNQLAAVGGGITIIVPAARHRRWFGGLARLRDAA